MISQKLQDAINAQIVAEMWSANLYLSMSYFFAAKGYEGFASWMKAQAHEENDHADMLAQYVMKRGGQARWGLWMLFLRNGPLRWMCSSMYTSMNAMFPN